LWGPVRQGFSCRSRRPSAIVAATPERFAVARELVALIVVGGRDADVWAFTVSGSEQMQVIESLEPVRSRANPMTRAWKRRPFAPLS
jgi:hypothetical protein